MGISYVIHVHTIMNFKKVSHTSSINTHIISQREREREMSKEKELLKAFDLIRDQKSRLVRFELGMCLEDDVVKLEEVNREILKTIGGTTSSPSKKKRKTKMKKSDKTQIKKDIQRITSDVEDKQQKLIELAKKVRLLRAFLS